MMPLRRLVVALGLVVSAWAPAAAAQPQAWDDATLLRIAGNTFLLDSAVDDAIIEAPAMRANLERVGLTRSCAIAHAARKAAVAEHAAAFSAALVDTMRTRIPADQQNGLALPGFTGPQAKYRYRVVVALERDAAPIFAGAKSIAIDRFEREIATAPSGSQDWAGIFADWDLTRNSALHTACFLLLAPSPAPGKRLFDGFYQRKENH